MPSIVKGLMALRNYLPILGRNVIWQFFQGWEGVRVVYQKGKSLPLN